MTGATGREALLDPVLDPVLSQAADSVELLDGDFRLVWGEGLRSRARRLIKGFEFARKHRAEGEARGVAKGKAEAVVAVLEGRGLSISDETRQTLLACRDAETLDRWLAAAGTVASSDELLPAPNDPHAG